MATFIPRTVFPTLTSLPKSYFLGHHAAGLTKMKSLLTGAATTPHRSSPSGSGFGGIDLVLECRDYRIPLTSRNPLLESALRGTSHIARIIVYTKRDLGMPRSTGTPPDRAAVAAREASLRALSPDPVVFAAAGNPGRNPSVARLLGLIKTHARAHFSLTGTRVLVAGMPNVGKSSLLNALRAEGASSRADNSATHGTRKITKAAATGAQPGVTRKVGTAVKIVSGAELDADSPGTGDSGSRSEGVYLHDTPGVFMPYVAAPSAMLKLALCGAVKDGLVPPLTAADYLLFRLNLVDPAVYAHLSAPTNDVGVLLEGIARKTGKLRKGAEPDMEGAALWLVQRWRSGDVGRFVLDSVDDGALDEDKAKEEMMSVNQAVKVEKERKRERGRERAREMGLVV